MDLFSLLIPFVAATILSGVKSILNKKESKRAETKLEEAEKQIFPKVSEALTKKLRA